MGRYCLVPTCTSNYNKNKFSIFKVPDKVELLKKWQDAIPGVNKLRPSQNICEKHFEEKFIIRRYIKHDADGKVIAEVPFQRPRLLSSAIPTIFNSNPVESPPPLILTTLISFHATDGCKKEIEVEATETDVAKDREETPVTDKAVVPCRRMELSSLMEHSYSAKSKQLFSIEQRHVTKAPSVDVPIEVKQEMSFEESPSNEKPSLPLPTSPSTRGWDFTSVIINERVEAQVTSDEDRKVYTAEIPHSWSVSELSRGPEQKLLFSHARGITRNGETIPIILKCVVLLSDGSLRYHVYGRLVSIPEGQHLRVLEKTSDLPKVLERFERANLCSGVGSVDVFQLPTEQVFQDYFHQWHHNACTLLSRTRRCKNCAHIRKIQLQKEARLRRRKTPPCRIRGSLNPVEEMRLATMRKKNECLRRVKNRTILRMNMLLDSLNK